MMCYIITVTYEFNNWKALENIVKYVAEKHVTNNPTFNFKVPHPVAGSGWRKLAEAYLKTWSMRPDDLTEMSVYGSIWFTTNKDLK